VSDPTAKINLIRKGNKMKKKMKHELEKDFKAVALASYNKDRIELLGLEPVDENDISFVAYLEAIVFGMIPREEFESWIFYYERKLARNE
jgi:hypothetical protein